MASAAAMRDRQGRTIRYLRISVTDRCDLRCRYCMADTMTFLPRAALLTLEEITLIAERFVARGVRKLRLTGGEPLVRPDLPALVRRLGRRLGQDLDELTLTTNGVRLARHAEMLFAAGVRRINVSLDSRDPATFRFITRHGELAEVLTGIAAAQAAGLRIRINMVALRGVNEAEIAPMLAWCGEQGFDLALIETMPLGWVAEDRRNHFLPLTQVLRALQPYFALTPDRHDSGGPARYWRVGDTAIRLGLIAPLTDNFCDGCNRMRLTAEGRLYLCLGQEDHVDLKQAIRGGDGLPALDAAIDQALARKPARHDFRIDAPHPALARHMSVTGG